MSSVHTVSGVNRDRQTDGTAENMIPFYPEDNNKIKLQKVATVT